MDVGRQPDRRPHPPLAAHIPEPVLAVCRRLQEAGFPCVLVGGAVRDLLRGRRPQDWDLASQARPEEVQALFRRVVPTGLAYGTVTVLDYGIPCQVTSFRREGRYEDGRHPAWVETGATLEEDLRRRDFTINAIAYDPIADRLIDPFGGRADLAAGVIRTVGSPDDRFREDALRILRALRIMSEEGFTIHPDTEPALVRQAAGLQRISGEREGAEMIRLLMGKHVKAALDLVRRLGLVPVLWPAFAPAVTLLQHPEGRLTVYEHTARAVAYAPQRLPVRLAAFGHDWGKVLARTPDGRFPDHHRVSAAMFGPVLRRWRVPQAVQEHVLALIRHRMFGPVEDKTLRRWIGRYGRRWVLDWIDLREADARANELGPLSPSIGALRRRALRILQEPVLTPNKLALDGHDIMAILGLGPGPEVGRWKEALYEYVLADPARNTREALTAFLLEQASAEEHEEGVRREGPARPSERDGGRETGRKN